MKLTINEIQKYGSEMLKSIAEICERNNIRWSMAYGSVLGAVRHKGPIPWDHDIDIYVPEVDIERFIDVVRKELPTQYWIDYRDDKKKARAFPRIGLKGYETEILHIDVYRLGGFPTDSLQFKLFAWYSRMLFIIWKSKTLDINYYYTDRKRRFISKTTRILTSFIPLTSIIKKIDKQAARIPFDEAKIVASPITTFRRWAMHDKRIFDELISIQYEDFWVKVPKEHDTYLTTLFGDWSKYPSADEREQAMNKIYEVREINKGDA